MRRMKVQFLRRRSESIVGRRRSDDKLYLFLLGIQSTRLAL